MFQNANHHVQPYINTRRPKPIHQHLKILSHTTNDNPHPFILHPASWHSRQVPPPTLCSRSLPSGRLQAPPPAFSLSLQPSRSQCGWTFRCSFPASDWLQGPASTGTGIDLRMCAFCTYIHICMHVSCNTCTLHALLPIKYVVHHVQHICVVVLIEN